METNGTSQLPTPDYVAPPYTVRFFKGKPDRFTKPDPCPICGKKFATKHALLVHTKLKHKESHE